MFPHLRDELQHVRNSLCIRLKFKQRGAKVEVDSCHIQVGSGECVPHRLFRLTCLDGEAEFLIQHTGRSEQVSTAVNARRDS